MSFSKWATRKKAKPESTLAKADRIQKLYKKLEDKLNDKEKSIIEKFRNSIELFCENIKRRLDKTKGNLSFKDILLLLEENERLIIEYPFHSRIFMEKEKIAEEVKLLYLLYHTREALIKLLLNTSQYKKYIAEIKKLMKKIKHKQIFFSAKTHRQIINKSLKENAEIFGGAKIEINKNGKVEIRMVYEDKERGGPSINGIFIRRLMLKGCNVYWHTHLVPSTISSLTIKKPRQRLLFDKENSDWLGIPFLLLHPKGVSLYYAGKIKGITLE